MQDNDENNKITAFDTLFSNDHIRMCKILLPRLNPDMQQAFALYIKLAELTYTMNYLKLHPVSPLYGNTVFSQSAQMDNTGNTERDTFVSKDISAVCKELIPYSSGKEREKLSRIIQLFQQIDQFKDMMEMVNMMKELFPEGGNDLGQILSGISQNSENGSGFSIDPSMLAELMKMMNPNP